MRIWLMTEDASTSSRSVPSRSGKAKTVGVLEKKANTTYIGGEVVIGKEAKGDVKVRGCWPPALCVANRRIL
jgi:hypothetical protein